MDDRRRWRGRSTHVFETHRIGDGIDAVAVGDFHKTVGSGVEGEHPQFVPLNAIDLLVDFDGGHAEGVLDIVGDLGGTGGVGDPSGVDTVLTILWDIGGEAESIDLSRQSIEGSAAPCASGAGYAPKSGGGGLEVLIVDDDILGRRLGSEDGDAQRLGIGRGVGIGDFDGEVEYALGGRGAGDLAGGRIEAQAGGQSAADNGPAERKEAAAG